MSESRYDPVANPFAPGAGTPPPALVGRDAVLEASDVALRRLLDRDLVPRAKRYAKQRGVSLSSLIEATLDEMTRSEAATSFVDRWRGTMVPSERDEERYRQLRDKYG